MSEIIVKEIIKKVMETAHELPKFARNLKPEHITSFKEADKPLHHKPEKVLDTASKGETKDTKETPAPEGGAYKDLPTKKGSERHHMPADSISPLAKGDGPCITMERGDHRKTGSHGFSNEAREYRREQKALSEQGKFSEAFAKDVEDIRSKFGGKYDKAIAQAEEHVNALKSKGVV